MDLVQPSDLREPSANWANVVPSCVDTPTPIDYNYTHKVSAITEKTKHRQNMASTYQATSQSNNFPGLSEYDLNSKSPPSSRGGDDGKKANSWHNCVRLCCTNGRIFWYEPWYCQVGSCHAEMMPRESHKLPVKKCKSRAKILHTFESRISLVDLSKPP